VRDKRTYRLKRDCILKGGFKSLHIVIDWDRTCTTQYCKGVQGDSCHGILERRRGEDLAAKAAVLNGYYYPIETSDSLSDVEKTPFMIQWYKAVNALIASTKMTKRELEVDVKTGNFELRRGVRELLDASRKHGFPVTIFSAGVGDVIEEILAQHYGPLPSNVRVMSNRMVWQDGVCTSFSENVLHPFNKNFVNPSDFIAPKDEPYITSASTRENVIVCGDGKGDALMAEGLTKATTVLRIGLLNYSSPTDSQIKSFSEIFDVVCLGDGPLTPLSELLVRLECT